MRERPGALNFAMPMITGDYVWFFDDDDVALRESIELRLNVLNAHPELSFVYTGHYLGSDDSNQRICRGKRYTPACPDGGLLLRHLMLGCYFTLQSVMLRRGALVQLGLSMNPWPPVRIMISCYGLPWLRRALEFLSQPSYFAGTKACAVRGPSPIRQKIEIGSSASTTKLSAGKCVTRPRSETTSFPGAR